MQTTIDLLNHVTRHGTDAGLAKHLRVSPTTISMARKVGRASPELAAKLASELTTMGSKEELRAAVKKWVTIAVAEQMSHEKRDWLLNIIGEDAAIDTWHELDVAETKKKKARASS